MHKPTVRLHYVVALSALGLAAIAIALEFSPSGRSLFIYDRSLVGQGELWRLWTGHLVHFGWAHCAVDTGLFLILSWLFRQASVLWTSLLLVLPPAISTALYVFDQGMRQYGGLSAVNLGLLAFLACQGWQRDWFDWFWPTVLILYVAELCLEQAYGGHRGGMIRFSESDVSIATAAHIYAAIFGVTFWTLAIILRKHRARTDN